ncbi:MAG: cation:proton antiporter [Desulfuromonadales bacterium]
MNFFQISTILIVLTALFSYFNYRRLHLPTTIGVLLISLFMSLGLITLSHFGVNMEGHATALLNRIDFDEALLHGMLAFLLFAGALPLDIQDMRQQKWTIALLATAGVLTSMFIVGGLSWYVFRWLDLQVSFLYCLLFGALISPTDPVAILGLIHRVGLPKELETKIVGESLFNDGFGVVVFTVLLQLVKGEHSLSFVGIGSLFLQETVGGILFGLVLGFITYAMLKKIDEYQVEILLTLAMVMGGYTLADIMHISGPLGIVVAGLLIGSHGRSFAMSDITRKNLDTFWELVDEILNAVLFVLIGLEILVIPTDSRHLLAGLAIIPVALFARWVSAGGAIKILQIGRSFSPGAVTLITWGGLRGGISVAMALSLPHGPARQIILVITYVVVVFSILVQGLTLERVSRKFVPAVVNKGPE